VIFLSDRPPRTTQICVDLALHAQIFFYVFSTRGPPPTGEDLNNFSFFECGPANNQPAVEMVAPDYHEEDGHSTASSSTQLPSQHPLRQRLRGHRDGGTDLSTVPPTPLSNRRHLMSPVRQSADGGNSANHHYLLRSTPERLAASGSRSGGEAGSRVSSRTGVVGAGIFGSVVGGGTGGIVLGAGTVVGGGIPADGVVAAGVAGIGGIPAVVDVGTGGLGVSTGGVRGGRVGRSGGGRGGGGGGATRRTRQPTGHAAGGTARGGVRNYSAAEVDSLLQTIRAVCPIGNDHWEIVADLHSNSYADCGRTVESIKRKFSSLASTQPGSGNPTMPPAVATAKEIRELINAKAGINDLDVSDCFEEEEEDDDMLDVSRPPQQIAVAGEAAVITQMTQIEGEALNNQQQQDSAVTQRDRRASAASSGPLSTLASVSVAQSKGRTRQNVIVSAIDSATSSSNNTFAALLQQRQLSEEFEMRQRRLEREEERQRREEERARREEERLRREEELHEMRRKESRQQEERSMLFQLAMTGLIAYLGIKKKDDDDGKPHGS